MAPCYGQPRLWHAAAGRRRSEYLPHPNPLFAAQFHGHAQVMLSDAPFPALQAEAEAIYGYDLTAGTMSRGYSQDVLAAHDEVRRSAGSCCSQPSVQAALRARCWLLEGFD